MGEVDPLPPTEFWKHWVKMEMGGKMSLECVGGDGEVVVQFAGEGSTGAL